MTVLMPWVREDPDLTDYQPVIAYPKPPPADPGPPRVAAGPAGSGGATAVAYAPAPAVPARVPAPAPPVWAPKVPGAPAPSRPGRAVPAAVTWCRPPPPGPAAPAKPGRTQVTASEPPPLGFEVNYDPPDTAMGTGLFCSNQDGSMVVHPLSVVHPGSTIGDEGPINEAFLISPVVYLCAGRPYALASPVVIPNGATLYCNRAAIDRSMFVTGEGATIYD